MDGEDSELGDHDQITDDYAERNGRKVAKPGSIPINAQQDVQQGRKSLTSGSLSATPPLNGYGLAGGGSFHEHVPYATSGATREGENGEEQEVGNDTAAQLFQSPIHIPTDALHLLLKASGQSEDLHRKDLEAQRRPPTGKSFIDPSPSHKLGSTKPVQSRILEELKPESNIDPAIAGTRTENGRTPVPRETLDIWSRLRFVRAGWFTAREGIAYMN